MTSLVKTTVENGIAIVAIDNPPVNALSREALAQLAKAIRGHLKDRKVRGIVLMGEGNNFAAGADIRDIADAKNAAGVRPLLKAGHALLDLIAKADLPVVAAIHGFCYGGGCELALACPLRVAGERVKFAQPEIKLGIMPGWGATQRLPRLVGPTHALEMLLTGEAIPAKWALQIGLVNLVVPDEEVRERAVELSAAIGRMSRVSISKILRAVRQGCEKPLAQGLALEAKLFGEMMSTQDKKIGIQAFFEKNPHPGFKDR